MSKMKYKFIGGGNQVLYDYVPKVVEVGAMWHDVTDVSYWDVPASDGHWNGTEWLDDSDGLLTMKLIPSSLINNIIPLGIRIITPNVDNQTQALTVHITGDGTFQGSASYYWDVYTIGTYEFLMEGNTDLMIFVRFGGTLSKIELFY